MIGQDTGTMLVVFGAMLLIGFATDLRERRIPNWLTISGSVLGVSLHVLFFQLQGLWFSLGGLALLFFVMFLFYLLGAWEAGDVKWFAAAGAILGAQEGMRVLVIAVLLAGVFGLVLLIIRGSLFKWMRNVAAGFIRMYILRNPSALADAVYVNKGNPIRFPFMLAVLPAAILELWLLKLI